MPAYAQLVTDGQSSRIPTVTAMFPRQSGTRRFLCKKVHARTYYLSERDRFSEFRCLFRAPLKKVDDLVSIFLENNWIPHGRASETDETFKLKITAVSDILRGTLRSSQNRRLSEGFYD